MSWLQGLRKLRRDERGDTTATTLGFTLTYFVAGSVFLCNVQLGQLCYRRDVVDHAAALAADTAMKTYCAKQESSSAAESAARKAIDPVMSTINGQQHCNVQVQPSGGGSSDPGSQELEVSIDCQIPCDVPLGSEIMCHDGKVTFNAKKKTAASGCDGQGYSQGSGT